MFCPQCGQQAPNEVRYCPRCGLSLVPHVAILAGYQPASASMAAPPTQAPVRTARSINKRRGAKLIFFSLVLFPVFLLFSFAVDSPGPLLLPALLFMMGLVWWLYARLFSDDLTEIPRRASRRDLKAGGDRPALGATQFVPATLFNQQNANTSEIAPPRSVTESTTKLLDKDV